MDRGGLQSIRLQSQTWLKRLSTHHVALNLLTETQDFTNSGSMNYTGISTIHCSGAEISFRFVLEISFVNTHTQWWNYIPLKIGRSTIYMVERTEKTMVIDFEFTRLAEAFYFFSWTISSFLPGGIFTVQWVILTLFCAWVTYVFSLFLRGGDSRGWHAFSAVGQAVNILCCAVRSLCQWLTLLSPREGSRRQWGNQQLRLYFSNTFTCRHWNLNFTSYSHVTKYFDLPNI